MIREIILSGVVLALFSFSIKKEKKFVPPGTVQINEKLFADETEVTNLSWMEYELWTASKYGFQSKEHLATLPDTTVWRNKTTYNEPFVAYYYRHRAYRHYPVVGVSYEQVQAFCKWRTERVKTLYYLKHKRDILFEYRLPTKQEWEFISDAGISVFLNDGRDKKGLPQFNCARNENESQESKQDVSYRFADVTAPVNSYSKNRFGLFNTIGNVAEMVKEDGICKGGSWCQNLEDCRVGKNMEYSKPEAWLGFRCVCVLGS